jgi:hypothetical protein
MNHPDRVSSARAWLQDLHIEPDHIASSVQAERSTAQAQLGLARSQAQRLIDTARLYMALGGTPVPASTAANSGAVATP